MNFFYANGTQIINSLKVTSEVPLDPRLTVENIAERDSLVTNHISYDRMKVYVKSNDTKYIYHKDTGEWEIDNKFSEEDKSKLDRIDNYLIDTEYIYNPENKLLYREHSYDPNTDITTLRDHILQEARVSENGELYNGLLSKFYVNRLNNITNYLIDVSFTKGTDVPNLYLTTHSYNPDEDKTTLTNIDIPLATDDNHGLLSNLQNIKVNRIVDYVNRIDTTHTNAPDTGLTYNYNIYNPFTNANVTKTILIPLVTHTENGLTSSSDKIKIDDIETYVKSIALRQASGTEELGINYIITNPNDQTDTPGYFNIPLVTDSRNGLVSPARKHWMDNASGVSNTGTTSDTWQLDKKDINTRLDPNGGVIIKDSGGIAEIRNNTDSAYSDLTLNNITIKGDVTLEGKSFITEAETVEVRDNTLLLNRGETGAGVSKEFAGIEIDRGSEPKYQILFDESDDRFKVGKEGDLWCVTLRDDEADMVNGMFTTWDSTTKRLKTTNIVPSSSFLYFGDNKTVSLNYSPANDGSLTINTNNQYLAIFTGDNYTNFRSTRNKFQFIGDLYTTGTKYALTFKRGSDNSEVLYHADIINDLTTGGTNKVLSAEQGKILQNSITSIQGSYLPLSGGAMTGPILVSYGWDIRTNDGNGILKVISDKSTEIGNLIGETRIRSNSNDLLHMKKDASYKIWDAYNLPDPVTLSSNNTFTGNNTFQAGKFNVGSFKVTSSGSLLVDINSQGTLAWSRNIMFRANSDNTSSSRFGGYNSTGDTSIGYAYIGIGDVDHSTAQYKFYSNKFSVSSTMVVPESSFRIFTGSSTLLYHNSSEKKVIFGNSDSSVSLELMAKNLYYKKYDTESSTWKNYIIYSEYNLSNPVRYTLDDVKNPTFLNNEGNIFSYIKAGSIGILPNTSVSLSSGGTGTCGNNEWAFKNGYFANIYTNKLNFSNSCNITANDTSFNFITNNGAAHKIASGSLYIGSNFKETLLALTPTNGIFSVGHIKTESAILFTNNTWTNDLAPNRNSAGYLQVLDAYYNAANAVGPTNYGTVLQVNSRINHWANQLWFGNNDNMYLRRMNYGSTTYGEWNRLLTNKDVNIIPTRSASNPSSLPVNQIFYSEIHGVDGTPTSKGLLFSAQGDDEGIQLWADSTRTELYYRTKWVSFGNWIKLATTSDLGNYLPLSGGTLSGNLTINTVGSTTFVINNNDTNGSETFMRVLRKGTASAAIGFRDSLGAYIYNYNSNKYLFIDNDGYARVGTTSGSTRLALITDIPTVSGYLPLSGGIVTGDIKLNTEAALYTAASSGSGYSYYKTISYDNDKGIILGASNTSIKIQSSDPRIYHIYKGTEYEIYSTNSLPTPVFAPGKVAGSLTPIYNNSFYINDSSYKVATIDNSYSFPKIYSPTSAGTSGQILQSTGGVPTWVNASSIGGNYVSKSGDTMTGKLIAQGGINLNNVGKTGISFYSTSYVTWVEYMTNTGSGLASTGGTSSSYGNVTSWARRSTIEQTSGYGWIWDSCANSSGANPDPKMALSSNNGNLYVKGTITSNGKTVATTDQIPSIPSISISNSGSGNAVTSITASGHTLTVTKGATYLTSSSLDGYATQTWANGQFAPLSRFNTSTGYTTIKVTGQEFNFDSANPEIFMNYRTLSGSTAVTKITWKGGSNSTLCEGRWGNLYMNNNLVATQSWAAEKFPNKTGTGASGTWGISITGNAATATTATKWNGYSIWTGTEDELPSSRDTNTLYFVKKSS